MQRIEKIKGEYPGYRIYFGDNEEYVEATLIDGTLR
jgi:hypothetical protein